MKNAAISDLKTSFSQYLDRVRKGEEVIVTDRGHPVARLVPFGTGGPNLSERARLAREGIIEMGASGLVPEGLTRPSPIKDPSGNLLKALLKEREEQV